MRLAIMQPYFFPYLGHFQHIASVDTWVVFDTVQYIRRGWMNRNRILHPEKGWQYINVPVKKHSRDSLIRDIGVANTIDWRSRLLGQLQHYKGKAPHFQPTMTLVETCLAARETCLSRLNVAILDHLCNALDTPFNPVFLSQTGIETGDSHTAGEKILTIARALNADTYINPAGGRHLLDRQAFEAEGIALEIQAYENPVYDTTPYRFEPGLSIIDALMWYSRQQLHVHLTGRG